MGSSSIAPAAGRARRCGLIHQLQLVRQAGGRGRRVRSSHAKTPCDACRVCGWFRLTDLGVLGKAVTDAGVKDLARADTGLKGLTSPSLQRTSVTGSGIAAAEAATVAVVISGPFSPRALTPRAVQTTMLSPQPAPNSVLAPDRPIRAEHEGRAKSCGVRGPLLATSLEVYSKCSTSNAAHTTGIDSSGTRPMAAHSREKKSQWACRHHESERSPSPSREANSGVT